jgi:hypothetical protein
MFREFGSKVVSFGCEVVSGCKNAIVGVLSHRSSGAVTGAAVVGGATALASATTPTMDPIAFPVDVASIVSEVGTAGATILIAFFGLMIGFVFIKRLARASTRAAKA